MYSVLSRSGNEGQPGLCTQSCAMHASMQACSVYIAVFVGIPGNVDCNTRDLYHGQLSFYTWQQLWIAGHKMCWQFYEDSFLILATSQ